MKLNHFAYILCNYLVMPEIPASAATISTSAHFYELILFLQRIPMKIHIVSMGCKYH